MLNWARQKIGVAELEQRMTDLEMRVVSLEDHMDSMLKNFGSYKSRTGEELALMERQINDMLDTVESVIQVQENQIAIQKAIRLRSRLRNHSTRISNALCS